MSAEIENEPLARLQYVSVSHPNTLDELYRVEQDALLSMAVYLGSTRLIDNFLLRDGIWQTGQIMDEAEA
jgi:pantoate--beta-alanine ligase